jgi:Transposase DDE domain
LRSELFSESLRDCFRVKPVDFSRERVLTLPRVATLILRGHKVSQQNALNKFLRELDQLAQVPTSSAYCQARQKLQPELFVRLNQVAVSEFVALSEADGSCQRWHGHRVYGVDGTKLNLPDTPALRRAFSVVSNQHGEQGERVQALSVVLYDLLNDLGVRASLGALAAEKEPLFAQLWGATQGGDLLVMDRGFLDYAVIALAAASGREVLIRCPRQSFAEVNDFWASEETDRLVTIQQSRRQKEFVRAHELPTQVTVRLLKFTLPTGEPEVLLTTLCDQPRYPRAEFYQLYGWRWGEETYFDRVKNIFEVERFSGKNERAIRQDFDGVIFLASLESILSQSAQQTLAHRDRQRGTRVPARVNRAVSYVTLLDHVVALLADPALPLERALAQIHGLLQTSPTRERPGRNPPRQKRSVARSLRNQRYRKRLNA